MIYSIKSWFHNNKRSFNAILSKKIPSPKAIGLGNFVSFYDFGIFYYEISDLDWPLSSRTA